MSYLEDAGLFLREATRKIDAEISREDTLQAALNLALGVERLLKEVLVRVNPIYVLMNPEFKNSMPLLYEDRILAGEQARAELASEPNGDVLTFRNSLLRAVCCSSVAHDNKGLLFRISHFRDVIAHNSLSLIDLDKLKLLLARDAYPLLAAFASELGCSQGKFFSGKEIRLAELSARLEEDVAKALKRVLESHQNRWNKLKNRPGYVEDKDEITREVLSTPNKAPIECPACGSQAVIYGQPELEFNPYERREVVIGIVAKKLRCHYCKLGLDDYKFIDHLKLNDHLKAERPDENDGEGSESERAG
jgi:hypothetical protein